MSAAPATTAVPRLAIGVTGTDTGVGKTVVATAVAATLRSQGMSVGVLKPVETGVTAGSDPVDATHLRLAAGAVDPLDHICPYSYADAVAPAVAAERSGRPILQSTLDAAFHRMAHGRDAVIVEGAGGLLVPMAPGVSYEDLCVRWMLDLLVVAANRLGVINHTALTVRSARRAGLRIVAVVLNTVTTRSPDVAEQTNLETLRTLLPGTAVLSFPFVRDPTHIPALVAAAAACGLPSSLPVPVPS